LGGNVRIYYMLDNNGTLYSVENFEKVTSIMSNVSSVIMSDELIYANGKAISKRHTGRRKYGKFSIGIKDKITTFKYNGKQIDIKEWNGINSTNVFLDTNNTLHCVIDGKYFQLDENVTTVGLASSYVESTPIYWNVGSALYRRFEKKNNNWQLDSEITTICCGVEVCFILTISGNLYFHANVENLEDEYIRLLPKDIDSLVDKKGDMLKPILVKTDVKQISFHTGTRLLVI